MYLRIYMKTKFCQLHFRGRSTLHKSVNFTFLITVGTLSSAKLQFGSKQNKIKKLENNKLLFYIYVPNPFH